MFCQIPFWWYDFKIRTEVGTFFRHWQQSLKGNIGPKSMSINQGYNRKDDYINCMSLHGEIRESSQIESIGTSQSHWTGGRKSHVSRHKSAITSNIQVPHYSPYLAATHYHLFSSVQNILKGKSSILKSKLLTQSDNYSDTDQPHFTRTALINCQKDERRPYIIMGNTW